ncbi:hypothetical protein OK016_00420 [Vibrio chagasii]|nr:hypothetical protein [Vibrio chagasii]
MAECPENQVCSNHTPVISGHEYPTDMPEWNVAPSEKYHRHWPYFRSSDSRAFDPDGDEVIADSKTLPVVYRSGECFASSPTLTINPSDIDKVFDKGVGFKPLDHYYSGKVDKGYPEATRTFESGTVTCGTRVPTRWHQRHLLRSTNCSIL